MISVRSIPARDFPAELAAAWAAVQTAQAALSNPLFRPEFTRAVAAERNDVEVAVLEQAGQPVGFLPLERSRRGHAAPVGSHINECQGAIVQPGVAWLPQAALAAIGLRSWKFDHLGAGQTVFEPFRHVVAASPYLDLSPPSAAERQPARSTSPGRSAAPRTQSCPRNRSAAVGTGRRPARHAAQPAGLEDPAVPANAGAL